jgi:hypothetical protein
LYICIRMITAPHILIPDCSIPISLVAPGTDTITAKTLPHATISRRPYHPTSGVCLTFPPCRSGAAAMLDGSQKATHDKRTLGEGGSAVSASSAVLCRGGSGYSLHTHCLSVAFSPLLLCALILIVGKGVSSSLRHLSTACTASITTTSTGQTCDSDGAACSEAGPSVIRSPPSSPRMG